MNDSECILVVGITKIHQSFHRFYLKLPRKVKHKKDQCSSKLSPSIIKLVSG